MPHILVLFDIDGTLLITRGTTTRCMKQTFTAMYGDGFRWTEIPPGTIDPLLFEHQTRRLDLEDIAAEHDCFKQLYLATLREELRSRRDDVKVMPGVHALIDSLKARDDVVLGLLTGNYRQASFDKLITAGLDPDDFTIRVFAEDGPNRDALVPAALDRYATWYGRTAETSQTIIVGDTPLDVSCAKANGCRSLAVATGRYSVEDLQQAGADRVVSDLTNPAPVYAMIR